MMKNPVLAFLSFQADINLGIIHKNYIRPERGFNKNIINNIKNKIKHFSDNDKFFVILMDEMKIQSNLVWGKHTGELIGYFDLGDT